MCRFFPANFPDPYKHSIQFRIQVPDNRVVRYSPVDTAPDRKVIIHLYKNIIIHQCTVFVDMEHITSSIGSTFLHLNMISFLDDKYENFFFRRNSRGNLEINKFPFPVALTRTLDRSHVSRFFLGNFPDSWKNSSQISDSTNRVLEYLTLPFTIVIDNVKIKNIIMHQLYSIRPLWTIASLSVVHFCT